MLWFFRGFCSGLIFVASPSLAESIMIECHFVPYSNCHIEVVYNSSDILNGVNVSNLDVSISQNGIILHPGLYSSSVSLQSQDRIEVDSFDNFYFRVRGDRINFDKDFSELTELDRFMSAPKDSAIKFAVLKTQRIPLIIPDPEIREGNIEVRLHREGRRISHSKAYMNPYGGCWFDEARCVDDDLNRD